MVGDGEIYARIAEPPTGGAAGAGPAGAGVGPAAGAGPGAGAVHFLQDPEKYDNAAVAQRIAVQVCVWGVFNGRNET